MQMPINTPITTVCQRAKGLFHSSAPGVRFPGTLALHDDESEAFRQSRAKDVAAVGLASVAGSQGTTVVSLDSPPPGSSLSESAVTDHGSMALTQEAHQGCTRWPGTELRVAVRSALVSPRPTALRTTAAAVDI